ncbi:flagellar hook-basal body complex protein FliE [Sulfitobacter sp. S0837]|uniref:flagellar hook-basal body complex protein FliE n=1 Tax=Sulfitobacter maritimus TaxID=2741719 RepID=UPI0015841644|nr:flagellar hook-basal body complex protein FliE [Sulfitobacter maritimus]NUH66785.1 flagellar hook-basal body complex protein FliE [Sulfitobacter maritimus]
MDIKALSAIQKYAASKPATEPGAASGDMNGVKAAFSDFANTLAKGEQLATDAMVGDADPHALVTALAQTELVVETAVTVRNKVVEAYQEILRMPV